MHYQGDPYIGCVMVDEPSFCEPLVKLLKEHLGKPLAEIGKLDVPETS
jgi:hypothetical protein